MLQVADNDFNRANYPNEIGKIYARYPGYILMQKVYRPSRDEWKLAWSYTRKYALGANDLYLLNSAPDVKLATECRVLRGLAILLDSCPSEQQLRMLRREK